MEKELEKYYHYYESEYAKITGLYNIKGDEWLMRAVKRFAFGYSSIWRHESMANIKYMMLPKKVGQICTSFKIHRDRYSTIYALLYSHYDNGVKHDFVTLSSTYKSADGEYRRRFVPVQQILTHRSKYAKYYTEIEQVLLEEIARSIVKIKITVNGDDEIREKTLKDIESKKLAIIFYIAEWFHEYTRKLKNTYENHIATNYHEAMFSSDYTNVWKLHEDLYNKNKAEHFRFYAESSFIALPGQNSITTEAGSKIIPLTVKDVERIDDIKLAPWREMYITSRVSNLVINGITAASTILGDWFFVKSSPELYDNEVSHAKIKHSMIAEDIIKRLEDARKHTYVLNPINKREIYLSYKMEGLSEATEIPVNYAEQEIILSKWCLVAVEEHMGRTLGDFPELMMRETYRNTMGPVLLNFDYFCKYIFEIIYGLMCINEKLGVVHGDLHINNITFFNFTDVDVLRNPSVIYNVGGELYLFPAKSKQAVFIDFSRGFIWHDSLSEDLSPEKILQLKRNHQFRIMETLFSVFPDYTSSNKNNIELALERHFDMIYKVFQLVDTWKILSGWEYVIKEDVLPNRKRVQTYCDKDLVEKTILPFLAKLKNEVYNYFTTYMDKIINTTSGVLIQVPYFNRALLVNNFEKYRIKPETVADITLVDYWNSTNDIIYKGDKYDNFPPMIKFDYVIKHKLNVEDYRMNRYNNTKNQDHEKVADLSAQETADSIERRGATGKKDDTAKADFVYNSS